MEGTEISASSVEPEMEGEKGSNYSFDLYQVQQIAGQVFMAKREWCIPWLSSLLAAPLCYPKVLTTDGMGIDNAKAQGHEGAKSFLALGALASLRLCVKVLSCP